MELHCWLGCAWHALPRMGISFVFTGANKLHRPPSALQWTHPGYCHLSEVLSPGVLSSEYMSYVFQCFLLVAGQPACGHEWYIVGT